MFRIRTLLFTTAVLLAAGCGAAPTATPDSPALSAEGSAPTDTVFTTSTTCETCEDGGGYLGSDG